ncbi:hypothetical protein D8M09_03765 [Enterobacter sp. R1(2018)]|nr:hypothetical protein D8M09_03765 [Enterobacter sp. R1(2018)]
MISVILQAAGALAAPISPQSHISYAPGDSWACRVTRLRSCPYGVSLRLFKNAWRFCPATRMI